MRNSLLAFVFMLLCQPLWALDIQADLHYVPIKPEPAVGSGPVVVVNEFFMYGCPHCFQLEPYVKAWQATRPENVEFVRVPAMFGGSANIHGKAYYALEAMGELERLHEAWFEAIHKQRRALKTREELEAFLQEQGVDLAKFREMVDSFAVQTKANQAAALMRRYGIRSVPTMVIDGRYRSGTGFSGYGDIIGVTAHLVEKVRADRGPTAQLSNPPQDVQQQSASGG